MTYKVGDVLLCHKHIGVAKFIGKLHGSDYKQLSSKFQNNIKKNDIWVGLQLAEQPDIRTLSLMKPHRKHSKSLKAISHEYFSIISFSDYFTAKYGVLIPYDYIHKKIKAYEVLTKLTEIFHKLKRTEISNHKLTQNLKRLQNEMKTLKITKKVKSTSQKSLESIIYDQNGNSYHHHQKITRTTTHSYCPFKKHNNDEHDEETKEDDSTIVSLDNTTPITKPPDTKPKTQTHQDKNENEAHHDDNDDDHNTTKYLSGSDSASDKAVDGVKDNHSERNMSDCESCADVDDPPKKSPPNASVLLPSFNPEQEAINEEDEQDYTLTDANGNRLSHARRYSAPWDDKKLKQEEFGSAYQKMYDPYWKNSGSRDVSYTPHNDAIHANDKEEKENEKEDASLNKHEQCDSAEMNMLPMIKEDPTTNRMYRLSRVQHNQQRHKRSVSMSAVKLPRYFFEIDEEYPDLPDL